MAQMSEALIKAKGNLGSVLNTVMAQGKPELIEELEQRLSFLEEPSFRKSTKYFSLTDLRD